MFTCLLLQKMHVEILWCAPSFGFRVVEEGQSLRPAQPLHYIFPDLVNGVPAVVERVDDLVATLTQTVG